jgi:TonB family protein
MGLEGSVVFNLLIDDQGKVRQAELVEGLIEEMNREAKRAVQGYVFSPAFVEGKPVASKIRFSVRFVLEES